MATMEDLELLKAVLAVAVADGELRRSEMGIIKGLAERVGIGRVSLDAMMAEAESNPAAADNILIHNPDKARQGLEMLVAQARLDGVIDKKERAVLVRIALSMNITGEDFQQIYTAGIKRADALRKSRES
jgi:uncharacterized tellurite resistance protein B-like protein